MKKGFQEWLQALKRLLGHLPRTGPHKRPVHLPVWTYPHTACGLISDDNILGAAPLVTCPECRIIIGYLDRQAAEAEADRFSRS